MYEGAVSIFFKLVNFVAVVAAIVFLFRKYLLPELYTQWTDYKRRLLDLETQRKALGSHSRSVDNEIRELKQRSLYLRSRLQLWGDVVSHKVQVREEERKALSVLLERLHALQSERLKERSYRSIKVNEVFEDAKEKLVQYYKGEPGRRAVEDMITRW